MKISIDFDKVNGSLELKNIIKKSIIISAIVLNVSPLLMKDYLNNNGKLSLAIGGLIFSICSLNLPDTKYEEKLLKTYKDSSIKEHRLILTGELSKINTGLEIKNQIELTNLIEQLPEWQIPYFSKKYGVETILSSNYIKNNSDNYNISDEKTTLNINKNIIDNIIEKNENNIELNWIKKCINSSCVIAGKKRSGKTYLMKFLLSGYIEKSRDIDLFYISDPHYDDIDFDDCWVSVDIDKKLLKNKRLVKCANDTLSMLNEIILCGENRKKQGLTVKKNVGLIRLFMDEIDSYDSDIQLEITKYIKKIEYEYAKYGITCVIGCHSMKKSENGLDSSVISSMINVIFPSILLDRNNIFSGNYPSIRKIKSMIDNYKNQSLPSNARIVGIADDSDFYISHIPKLDLIKIEIDNSDDNNPIDKIKKWSDLCYQKYNIYPSKELIKKAWLDETNQDLSDKAIDLLIEKMGIKY